MIHGKCQCGGVQYEVDGDLVDFCHCHCSVCRRLHGAPLVSWGGVKRAEFKYTSGEVQVKTFSFSEKADSLFCGTCGSRLIVDYKPEADMLYLALGAVDGDINAGKGFHQFVGSKAPWFEITDDLPQFGTWPEDPD